MSNTLDRDVENIRAERAAVEAELQAVKRRADALRVEHARALLHNAFPHHSLAVFTRYWEEEEPNLLHILGGEDDIESWAAGTPEYSAACEAEVAIRLIGHDDDILEFLNAGEEHEGWIEFQLPLTTQEASS